MLTKYMVRQLTDGSRPLLECYHGGDARTFARLLSQANPGAVFGAFTLAQGRTPPMFIEAYRDGSVYHQPRQLASA